MINAAYANVIKVDRDLGYYVDGRGQVPEYQRIAPPNEGKVPTISHPTRTVVPFDTYYDWNKVGVRRPVYMTPLIPNKNVYLSNRRAQPYTRSEYLDVWCNGSKDYDRGVCSYADYNLYFFRASNWAVGLASAAWKNKGSNKPRAIFLMVDDLALDAVAMSDMKRWALIYGTQVHFGTIDSYIPLDWII